jgi:hypothetical protein
MTSPALVCFYCHRTPAEIPVYVECGQANEVSAEEYVWHEEGTLNRETGHFACDDCYVRIGMPVGERGTRWTAP